jgi:hypothetical protein
MGLREKERERERERERKRKRVGRWQTDIPGRPKCQGKTQ